MKNLRCLRFVSCRFRCTIKGIPQHRLQHFFADCVQIVTKLLILNERNMQILCRLCADIRKTFFAYIMCCCFEGCIIMQNRRGVVFMHPCCKNDTVPGFVTYLSHFLQSIEDISVSLCSKTVT